MVSWVSRHAAGSCGRPRMMEEQALVMKFPKGQLLLLC